MLKRFLVIAFQSLFFALSSVGQAGSAQTVQFRHYSTDEGFTGASFKTIAQDSLGFLWISSASGLYKFDGYNFIAYRSNPSDSVSLPQEVVDRIWVDPNGKVWLGFHDRISFYDRDIDGFRSYRISLGDTYPESLWFESDKVLWISAAGAGLIRFDINTRDTLVYISGLGDVSKHLARNTIREIKDEGQYLLLGTENGLWRFNKEKKLFTRPLCNSTDSALLYNISIKRIFPHDDHYWIWFDKGLVQVNTGFSVIRMLDFNVIRQRFDAAKSSADAGVVAVEQDKTGTFWIASQGLGLIRFSPDENQLTNFRSDKVEPNSLPSDVLLHLMIDRNENVWIATLPKGIVQLKKQSLRFVNHLYGISTGRMVLLHPRAIDYLIVASQGDGLWISEMNTLKLESLSIRKFEPLNEYKGFKSLTGVYKGKKYLWASSLTSGIIGLAINQEIERVGDMPAKILQHDANNPNTLSSNAIIGSMVEDEDGNLFAGTRSDGLNKISPTIEYGKKGSVIHYRHDPTDSTSIIDNGVIECRIENDHSVLVATQAGLDILRNGKFEHIFKNMACIRTIRASDGTLLVGTKIGLYEGKKTRESYSFTKAPLPGNPFITSIQEDSLGRIWCLTYEGLFFYDRKTKRTLVFKKEDGLPSSRSISGSGSVQTANGILIFSNAEGLTLFDPLSLRFDQSKPKPVITQLKVNNEIVRSTRIKGNIDDFIIPGSINTLNELTLDYTQNVLTLEFSAMDLTAPEKNQYEYMLEAFDNDWVQTDWKNRSATYTNLRPGDYTFKVRASNRDGLWGEYFTTLKIYVLPPPWKTWWAYSGYSFILAAVLFWARRNIVKEERLKASLKLEQVEREKEHLELAKAQEVDRLKSSFFTNISHEFRTPLTLIQGPVQMLMQEFAHKPKVKEQLTLIQNNTALLLKLINQLLELARLESGKLAINRVETDLNFFLGLVTASFSSQAKQKNIEFNVHLPPARYEALVDKGKLETILINLIGNAVKFTRVNGSVTILASIETASSCNSEQEENLRIIVSDTGIGISQQEQVRIFERFYQVNESHKEIGTGIGLALVKELTEMLNGTIEVKSSPASGSEFTFLAPVKIMRILSKSTSQVLVQDSLAEADLGNDQHEVAETAPRILVVEDNADLRKFIIASFDNGYSFIEASNGNEGFEKAIHEIPELIISDVMMPEMDGIVMTGKIKKDIRTSHIPVLLLTAKVTEESKLAGLQTGADDYLIKPFNKEELILKVKNSIAYRIKIREKIRLELLKESPKVEAQSADEQFLLKAKDVIHKRLNDPQLSVDSLTVDLGLSRAQLYRKITALTGVTVNELIRTFRLQRAEQLLAQRWGSVSEVAYEVGFTNLSYFSKCFKEQFGSLPSEYHAP